MLEFMPRSVEREESAGAAEVPPRLTQRVAARRATHVNLAQNAASDSICAVRRRER